MRNEFIQKNIKLSLDFDSYASRNPKIYDNIPKGSWVVLTVKGDAKFNRLSKSLVKNARVKKEKIVIAQRDGKKWKVEKSSK